MVKGVLIIDRVNNLTQEICSSTLAFPERCANLMSNAVWLADSREAWVAAEIVGSSTTSVTVRVLASKEQQTVALKDPAPGAAGEAAAGAGLVEGSAGRLERRNVFPAGSEGNAGVEDLISLPHLHEARLNHIAYRCRGGSSKRQHRSQSSPFAWRAYRPVRPTTNRVPHRARALPSTRRPGRAPKQPQPAVLAAITARAAKGRIYTHTGPILLAVNPFRSLPHLYDDAQLARYARSVQRTRRAGRRHTS